MKNWQKVRCAYFKNDNMPEGILEVINPDNGKVRYLKIPNNKAFKGINESPKYVDVYFDSKNKIKRVCQTKNLNISKKEIDTILDKIRE